MKAYTRPHYRQSRVWQRFARILKGVRSYAYRRKEEALQWCLERKTHGFCIPTELELEPTNSRGLATLTARIKEGNRFPEIRLRRRYNERRDRLEIEAVLYLSTALGAKAVCIGILPEEDVRWVRPLLKNGLELRSFVARLEKTAGATCRSSYHTGLSVTVAISRPDKAAREWVDIWSDRKEQRAESWSLEPAPLPAHVEGPHASAKTGSKVQVAGQPTVEDWLREDLQRRETCLSDLSGLDYWQVAPGL